jgi:phage terminase large subunit-like protein
VKRTTCKGCKARLSGRQRTWHSEACRAQYIRRTRTRTGSSKPPTKARSRRSEEPILGHQEPTYRLVPKHDGSRAAEAIELARQAGLELDQWQQDLLTDGMATNGSDWAASTIIVLCARQNGKTEAGIVRAAAGAALRGERVIWTAHQFRASRHSFRSMVELVETDAFAPYEPKVLRTAGQESIEFASGGRVSFIARSSGWSGRGLSIDLLVLDEAFALSDDQMAALKPSLAASKAGQVWYLSSAPHEDSSVLRRLALAGRAGTAKRTVYYEWVAPEDLAPSDTKAWAASNPAMGTRIELRTIADELQDLKEEALRRERLGWWAPEALGQVFDKATWASLTLENPPPADGPIAFGIDVPPSRDASCVAMAQKLGDGSVLVEIVAVDRGATWIVDVAATLAANRSPVIVDGAGWARELIEPLRGKGVDVRVTDVGTMAAACAGFFDAYVEGRLRHRNDPILTAAAEAAEKRPVGEARWAWARRTAKGNIAPIVAATLAVWGSTQRTFKLSDYVLLPSVEPAQQVVDPSGWVVSQGAVHPSEIGRLFNGG